MLHLLFVKTEPTVTSTQLLHSPVLSYIHAFVYVMLEIKIFIIILE